MSVEKCPGHPGLQTQDTGCQSSGSSLAALRCRSRGPSTLALWLPADAPAPHTPLSASVFSGVLLILCFWSMPPGCGWVAAGPGLGLAGVSVGLGTGSETCSGSVSGRGEALGVCVDPLQGPGFHSDQ